MENKSFDISVGQKATQETELNNKWKLLLFGITGITILLLIGFFILLIMIVKANAPISRMVNPTHIGTKLYFGLTRGDTSPITNAEFQNFINTIVDNKLTGYTLFLNCSGFFKDAGGNKYSEPSRVIEILWAASASFNSTIIDIMNSYNNSFNSWVLRMDTEAYSNL